MTYDPNIPQPGDELSDSQDQILNNFASANTTFGIDHYTFNNATVNKGRHKPIHLVKEALDPAAVADTYTLYSKDYLPDSDNPLKVPDTQLFGRTANGGISQFSGSKSDSDGYQWIGGVLLQWGVITLPGSTGTGTVTFKGRNTDNNTIPFPNNCFNVQLSLNLVGSPSILVGQSNSFAVIGNPTKLSFSWAVNITATATIRKLFWFAVGN